MIVIEKSDFVGADDCHFVAIEKSDFVLTSGKICLLGIYWATVE